MKLAYRLTAKGQTLIKGFKATERFLGPAILFSKEWERLIGENEKLEYADFLSVVFKHTSMATRTTLLKEAGNSSWLTSVGAHLLKKGYICEA